MYTLAPSAVHINFIYASFNIVGRSGEILEILKKF